MRILFLLLFCITNLAFGVMHPKGVMSFTKITINHAQVSETNGHFLFQRKIPRTGLIVDNCTTAVNAVVYKSDSTKIPKWVVYTTDTLFLYADVAISNTADSSIYVGYGLGVNAVNSASTFTNCGITHYYGLNDAVGSGTAVDYAAGNNLTVGAGVTMGNSCYFYKCATMGNLTTSTLTYDSDLFGTGTKVFDAIIKILVKNYTEIFRTGSVIIRSTASALEIYNNSSLALFSGTPIPTNEVCHLTVIRKSDGKVSVFVNGLQYGTETATTTPVAGSLLSVGLNLSSYTYNGTIEEFNLSTNSTSSNIADRHKMLFSPETFSTLSNIKSATSTGASSKWGLWNAVKQRMRAGFK